MSQLPATPGDSHVAWTVSSTAYLRNLEPEDLERECIAIHHQNAPKRNESGGTTLSVKCPALIVSLYYDPSEVADRVAAILNAHWDTFGEPAADGWQPIETAPKDGTIIDLWVRPYNGKAHRRCGYWWLSTVEVWRTDLRANDLGPLEKPTHWRLPPAAPAQEG